jgi:hypothetical protein
MNSDVPAKDLQYPPQPQQGYAPQQGNAPQQQQGYAPQQQQGYAPQQQQGYALQQQQGYAPQQQQGYAPQQQQGYAPQQQQGYAPQQQHGSAPQQQQQGYAYPPQYPPQGYPPQAFPPQSPHWQQHPQHGYVAQNPLMVLAPPPQSPPTVVIVASSPAPARPVGMWGTPYSALQWSLVFLAIAFLIIMSLASGGCTGPWYTESYSVNYQGSSVSTGVFTVWLNSIQVCPALSTCTLYGITDSALAVSSGTLSSLRATYAFCTLLSLAAAASLATTVVAAVLAFRIGGSVSPFLKLLPTVLAIESWVCFVLALLALTVWGGGVQANVNTSVFRLGANTTMTASSFVYGSGFGGLVTSLIFSLALGVFTTVSLRRVAAASLSPGAVGWQGNGAVQHSGGAPATSSASQVVVVA